jgi:hypothetical protein
MVGSPGLLKVRRSDNELAGPFSRSGGVMPSCCCFWVTRSSKSSQEGAESLKNLTTVVVRDVGEDVVAELRRGWPVTISLRLENRLLDNMSGDLLDCSLGVDLFENLAR